MADALSARRGGLKLMTSVRCRGCGRFRSAQLAGTANRPSCSYCEATAVAIGGLAALVVTPTLRAGVMLTPGDQRQGWERRWQDIQDEWSELGIPLTGPMSSQAIQAARQRLQSFYVNCYHLKDYLRIATLPRGVTPKAIENTITNEPDLALLCDMANLNKHGDLSLPPRSGDKPCIASWAGSDSMHGPGWHIKLIVEHRGQRRDGLDIAQRAIGAWRRVLHQWGMI